MSLATSLITFFKKTMEIVFVKTADELLKEALEDNMDLLSKL